MINLHNWVPYIVAFIVCLQLILFIMNLMRMRVFRHIFINEGSWDIIKDDDTGFVNGILGVGNSVFESIKESINKYLKNSAGSVIDFHLLKDSVDRHCESVEEEISAQMPVPLYCGLAGTMIGVILGLGSLLYTDSINALIGGSGASISSGDAQILMDDAATGINDLLEGVAWAMVASICGILFTTINSLLFKGCKLEAEKGKNEFLTWMQAKLLPELPDNTSEALINLVNNLNEFNNTFSHNTRELREALKDVNKSYAIQADIIKAVHDMDVMKMAEANVNVLKELKECTDKLEQFNDYLNSIHGYTDAIQRFIEQFNRESERLHILEEIRDFFGRNKAEIAKATADEDVMLRNALQSLEETSQNAIQRLNNAITEQIDSFKTTNDQMCNEYTSKLQQWPQLESQLAVVATLPAKIDDIAVRMVNSNNAVANRINDMTKVLKKRDKEREYDGDMIVPKVSLMPGWMRWLLFLCVIIITVVAVFVGIKTYNDMNTEDEEYQQAELVEATTEENNDSEQYPPAAEQDSVQTNQATINE